MIPCFAVLRLQSCVYGSDNTKQQLEGALKNDKEMR